MREVSRSDQLQQLGQVPDHLAVAFAEVQPELRNQRPGDRELRQGKTGDRELPDAEKSDAELRTGHHAAGELADLTVMGRAGEHTEWLDGLVGSTTEAVVRRAEQPVLVTGADTPGRERFMVAYDGSVHAKRALHTAAEIGVDWAMPCHVFVAGGKRADALLEEARSYLSAHRLSANYVARESDPSEAIIAYAEECHADLLVMGAYGHTKVRELVVGSTTAYALNHAPCPILLTR